MTTETLNMHRGDKTIFEIVLPGDQSSDSLGFGAKPDKDLDTARTFYKVTEGNANWVKTYDAAEDETTHLILVDSDDTETLTVDKLYWEVIDLGDDDNTIEGGVIYVSGDILSPNDTPPISTTATYHGGYSKFYSALLSDAGEFSEANSQNFTGTITPTLLGDTITLTSSDGEFDRTFIVETSGHGSIRPKFIDANSFEIELPASWETYWSSVYFEIHKR